MFRQIFRSIRRHFENNFLFYFVLFVAFTLGSIIGPLIIKRISNNAQVVILKLAHPYFKNIYLDEYSSFSIIKTSFVNNLFSVLLIGALGLVNIGVIFVPLIIFLKGGIIGFTVGFLVERFGVRGFLSALLGIYPQTIFIATGLIGVGAIAMTMASSFRMPFKNKGLLKRELNINEYIVLISIFTLIIIFGAIIEGILSPIIMKLIINLFI